MTPILVDTSVWVDHVRAYNTGLVNLLGLDRVMMHPMVLGDLARGTPPSRTLTLRKLGRLQQMQQANLRQVLAFIEQERLLGLGCGLVDLSLLASTLMRPGAELWTLDRRLGDLAQRFGVIYRPGIH